MSTQHNITDTFVSQSVKHIRNFLFPVKSQPGFPPKKWVTDVLLIRLYIYLLRDYLILMHILYFCLFSYMHSISDLFLL